MNSLEEIPMEWIDKIFFYLDKWFEEGWRRIYRYPDKLDCVKRDWQRTLIGFTKDEISNALQQVYLQSKQAKTFPPHCLDFWRLANNYRKTKQLPQFEQKEYTYQQPSEFSKQIIQEIKNKLKIK